MSSNGLTRVYLIRHGETVYHGTGKIYGQMDIPLSPRGEEQSRELAERLRKKPIAAVLSSDLQRASAGANLLADSLGVAVRTHPEFRERSLGVWQGLTWDEIIERYPLDFEGYRASRTLYRIPGAENFEDLSARVLPMFNRLLGEFSGREFALVCHGGVTRVILGEVLGLTIEKLFTFDQGYCCLNVIEYSAGGEGHVALING